MIYRYFFEDPSRFAMDDENTTDEDFSRMPELEMNSIGFSNNNITKKGRGGGKSLNTRSKSSEQTSERTSLELNLKYQNLEQPLLSEENLAIAAAAAAVTGVTLSPIP